MSQVKKFCDEWYKYYVPMLKFIKDTAVKGIGASTMLEGNSRNLGCSENS
jgi:hypothetical protein